jgi:hypothetical protein
MEPGGDELEHQANVRSPAVLIRHRDNSTHQNHTLLT